MSSEQEKTTLTEIEIQGYRSCRKTFLTAHPSLTALIGINGAGKTNLLNAIGLLRLNTSSRLYIPPSEQKQSGTANETVLTTWFQVGNHKIGYRLRLALSTSGKNSDEITKSSEEWNFASITKNKRWGTYPLGPVLYGKDRANLQRFRMYEVAMMNDYYARVASPRARDAFTRTTLNNPLVKSAVEQIYRYCSRISYYSASQFTDPSKCPSSFEIDSDGDLAESYGTSKGHAKYLHDLYTLRKGNPELYRLYEQFISKSELGLISRLSWKTIRLSSSLAQVKTGGQVSRVRKYKTLVIPKIQIGQSHITFNQLSEGTFKTLALIFYVMTDSSSCLLVEEPEVCVHHGLLSKIINTIKAYSSTKQVIFSTHSDLVLDQLGPENVTVVTMSSSGTVAAPMEKWVGKEGRLALTNYLEESGTLGEYWRSGGLS